jgi:galactokinase
MIDTEILKQAFDQRFGGEGDIYTAPGRINLIGEHTDYNGGFVMPGAIDMGISAMIRRNGTKTVNLYAIDMKMACSFAIDGAKAPEAVHFRYVYGVVREMMTAGVEMEGFDAVYGGDVPLGAGMSSSAALECCFAYALNELFAQSSLDRMTLARIGQATEHKHIGVMCGIMDQFASTHGKAGSLIRLDCRSGEYNYYPWHPEGYRLVVINSCVKHELVGSPYNDRRESCHRVAKLAGVETLRDCSLEMLERLKAQLSDEDYRRALYVIGEEQRVRAVCDALERDDYEEVGRQMYLTHQGLKEDYEVSCDEIDYLVEQAKEAGVSGSRIMGGGFGGCTINLLRNDICDSFLEKVQQNYRKRFGIECKPIPVVISDGARRLQ